MQKKPRHLTAANIINRLPLQQQLNSSQAMLIKLTPAWNTWVAESIQNKLLTKECLNSTHLSSLQKGKLVIASNNSANASHIKHQQQSLLTFLHKSGFKEIEQINVRLMHPTQLKQKHATENLSNQLRRSEQPSNNSLQAIKNCQKMVKNEQLANSLKNLNNTLKKTKN